ncbi:MAG: PepSY domain-containing protein [Leptolyngbya sp. RL_3_1]|nr:PepSY domain-containing protein [Leptolyngbya sp. RL_3_1]
MRLQLLVRKLHATIAPLVLLPLLITVTTGVTYRLGKSWFGLSRDQVHFLMTLHEGEYLGPTLEPIYVLLNGLGLIWMITTGGLMAWQNWQRSRPKPSSPPSSQEPQDTKPEAS